MQKTLMDQVQDPFCNPNNIILHVITYCHHLSTFMYKLIRNRSVFGTGKTDKETGPVQCLRGGIIGKSYRNHNNNKMKVMIYLFG